MFDLFNVDLVKMVQTLCQQNVLKVYTLERFSISHAGVTYALAVVPKHMACTAAVL
jgi:hypothetical protein